MPQTSQCWTLFAAQDSVSVSADEDFGLGEFSGTVGITEFPYGYEGFRLEFGADKGYLGGQGQVG